MPSLVIEIEGDYDADQIRQAMKVLGELIINKVKEFIRDMDLIQSGDYLQHWFSSWDGRTLIVESSEERAMYLEYGTYGYWDQYGEDNFPDPKHLKKREMTEDMKKQFPKGMQPFAPVRRVLYNEAIMQDLIVEAFNQV